MKIRNWVTLFNIFILSSFILCSCTPFSDGEPIQKGLPVKYAVLVMDMQKDFILPTGKLPVDQKQAEETIKNINILISSINSNIVEVVYIGNEFSPSDYIGNWFRNQAAISGQNGTKLVTKLNVINDTYFSKKHPDAFSNIDLDKYLREKKINHLIISGVFADQCVMSTSKGALQRQYVVSILPETVAAKNNKNKEKALLKYSDLGIKILSMERAINQLKR